MANPFFSLLLFLSLFPTPSLQSKPLPDLTSPYLSPSTIFPNFQKMLRTFKIFTYEPPKDFTFNTPAESLFYSSLLNGPFATQNPNEAHLFLVPFPSDLSTRSISRFIRDFRTEHPYWNRTLGADHFYISCAGLGYESDRNLVELKKNSVQISCFPTPHGKFIPHKDITLPPLNPSPLAPPQAPPNNRSSRYLGYFKSNGQVGLLNQLNGDPEFMIESEPSDELTYAERLEGSQFCLFLYGGDVSGIGEALRFGCVPAVITDCPIQDLPFMDVLVWSEIAVFVGRGGGAEELKGVLRRTCGDKYERMRALGVTASQHFVWNASPQSYDAFHTVLYQLWLRRHTIRYARREWS
ncbi:hypothetical protein L1049_011499 [Liquidambar formosana]|uniref:Exostosin GT47 domain-containing protein n=1 Tax=Liquidambar formosana TaxID=63359 RepID=A0AAP0RRJ4_LIQFO